MNFEPIGFEIYYSPSGVLLENIKIPRVLPRPLNKEKTVILKYPNPQFHTREGLRGAWLRECSDCGKEVATTINPFPGRTNTLVTPEKRFNKTTTGKPFSINNIKILKTKRNPIFCPDCKATPGERLKLDDDYLDYTVSLDKRKKTKYAKVYSKAYRDNNKEKTKAYLKEYYQKNKSEEKEKRKAYYEKNKEIYKVRGQAYRDNNKEKIKTSQKIYYENNKETIKAIQTETGL